MKLKPCPFCGGEAELWDNKLTHRLYGVICKKCDCMTPCFESEVEAIEAWNRRKPIDKIVEQLEESKAKDGLPADIVWNNALRVAIEIVKGGAV